VDSDFKDFPPNMVGTRFNLRGAYLNFEEILRVEIQILRVEKYF
jgi:hypothetical protein